MLFSMGRIWLNAQHIFSQCVLHLFAKKQYAGIISTAGLATHFAALLRTALDISINCVDISCSSTPAGDARVTRVRRTAAAAMGVLWRIFQSFALTY